MNIARRDQKLTFAVTGELLRQLFVLNTCNKDSSCLNISLFLQVYFSQWLFVVVHYCTLQCSKEAQINWVYLVGSYRQ